MSKQTVFNWKETGKNQYNCSIGKYRLRAEKSFKGHWWWCVYSNDEYVEASWWHEKVATEKKEAFDMAQHAYLEYLKSKND